MSENQSKKVNIPEGATLLEDGKHFHLKNEKYGSREKKIVKKSN